MSISNFLKDSADTNPYSKKMDKVTRSEKNSNVLL